MLTTFPLLETPPDFLVIGHICHDKIPGGFLPGGATAYAGLLAARLCLKAAALTSFGNDFLYRTDFQELILCNVPSKYTTIFENIYQNGHRTQFLHEKATDLLPAHLPQNWHHPKTVLLSPIADEVSFDFLDVFQNSTLCVCPQGWMRRQGPQKKVLVKPLENWEHLAQADIISISENDVGNDWSLIEKIGDMANLLVVTQGNLGATVFQKGKRSHFPAFPAKEIDPTGAGDVFAAAFSIKFSETKDVALSVKFAHCTASMTVEKSGMACVPNKKMVEERFKGVLSKNA